MSAMHLPSFAMTPLLAQPGGGRDMPIAVVLALVGGMIVLAIIGGVAVMLIRRNLLAKNDSNAASGSMLDELRRARDRGEISLAEFEAARGVLIARAQRSMGGQEPIGGTRPAPPRRSVAGSSATPGDRIAPPGYDLTGAPLPPRSSTPERGGPLLPPKRPESGDV